MLIERSSRGIHITRHWSKAAGYGTLLWLVIWFGMVKFFTSLGGQQSVDIFNLLAIPGIAMGYVAITRFLNSTVIDISTSEIVLRHSPLPWPGNRRFATRDVRALHTRIKKIHAKGYTYEECWIFVVRANGKKSMLVKGLEMSVSQMSDIATAISEHLDVPLL